MLWQKTEKEHRGLRKADCYILFLELYTGLALLGLGDRKESTLCEVVLRDASGDSLKLLAPGQCGDEMKAVFVDPESVPAGETPSVLDEQQTLGCEVLLDLLEIEARSVVAAVAPTDLASVEPGLPEPPGVERGPQ